MTDHRDRARIAAQGRAFQRQTVTAIPRDAEEPERNRRAQQSLGRGDIEAEMRCQRFGASRAIGQALEHIEFDTGRKDWE